MDILRDVLTTLSIIYIACFALCALWIAAVILNLFWVRRRQMRSMQWYIVIKYTYGDYKGAPFDAHYVSDSSEALRLASRGAMKPGEMVRGFWVNNEQERKDAIKLHDDRMLADRDWFVLVDRIESQWERVANKVRSL